MQRLLYQPNPFNPVDIEDDDDSEEEEEEDKQNENKNQIEQPTQPYQQQPQLQPPSPALSPKRNILLIKKCEEPEEMVQVVNQYWRVTADEIGDDEVSESSVQSKKNSPVQEHYFTEQLDESFERDYGCAEHKQTQVEIKGNGNKELVVGNTESAIVNTELAAVRVDKKVKETIQKPKEKPIERPKERKRDTRKKEQTQEEYKGTLSPNQKKYNQNDLPFITSKVLDSCLKLPRLYNPKNGRVVFQQQNINYPHTANNNSEDSLDDLPDVPQHDFHLLSDLIVNSAKLNIEKSQQINPRTVKRPTKVPQTQIPEHFVEIPDQDVKKIQWVNGKRCLSNTQYLVQYIARNRLSNRSQWVDATEVEEDGAVENFESLTHRQFLRLMIEKGQDKQMPPTFRIRDGKFIQPKKIQQKRTEIPQDIKGRENNSKQDIVHSNHKQTHKQPEVQKSKQQQPEVQKSKQSNRKQPVIYRQIEKSQGITPKQQNQLDLLDCDSIKFIEPSARTIQRMSRKKREKRQEPQESQTTREKSAEKVVAPWVPRKQVKQPKNDEVAQIKKLKEEMLQGRRGRREIKHEDLDTDETPIKGQTKSKRVKRLIEDSSEFEKDIKQNGDENEDENKVQRKLRPAKQEKLDADRMFDSFRMIQNLRFGKNMEQQNQLYFLKNNWTLIEQLEQIGIEGLRR